MEWKEHYLENIEFYFRIKNSSTHCVDFEAYELYHYDDGNGRALKFQYYDGGDYKYTSDADKCEPYVKGFIKWDGCSEVNFAQNIHSCGGRRALVRLGELFENIFKEAQPMMDSSGDYL